MTHDNYYWIDLASLASALSQNPEHLIQLWDLHFGTVGAGAPQRLWLSFSSVSPRNPGKPKGFPLPLHASAHPAPACSFSPVSICLLEYPGQTYHPLHWCAPVLRWWFPRPWSLGSYVASSWGSSRTRWFAWGLLPPRVHHPACLDHWMLPAFSHLSRRWLCDKVGSSKDRSLPSSCASLFFIPCHSRDHRGGSLATFWPAPRWLPNCLSWSPAGLAPLRATSHACSGAVRPQSSSHLQESVSERATLLNDALASLDLLHFSKDGLPTWRASRIDHVLYNSPFIDLPCSIGSSQCPWATLQVRPDLQAILEVDHALLLCETLLASKHRHSSCQSLSVATLPNDGNQSSHPSFTAMLAKPNFKLEMCTPLSRPWSQLDTVPSLLNDMLTLHCKGIMSETFFVHRLGRTEGVQPPNPTPSNCSPSRLAQVTGGLRRLRALA